MSVSDNGELTVELHVGVSGIYNILSSVLSYQFYIIAYTLDKISNIFRFISICMLLWQCDTSPFISIVSMLHASTLKFRKLQMRL